MPSPSRHSFSDGFANHTRLSRATDEEACESVLVISERQRVSAVARAARERLQPFVDMDPSRLAWFVFRPRVGSLLIRLGISDGVGAMLKMASFDVGGDSGRSDFSCAKLAQIRSHGEELILSMQSAALNYSVIFSLFLTIYLSLSVMHAGKSAYETDESTTALRLGASWDHSVYPWHDFAKYAYPNDAEAQAATRRALYVVECAMLLLGTFASYLGLFETLLLYRSLSVGLLSVISKCEYLLDCPVRLAVNWNLLVVSLFCLPVALPFILARSSAIAFHCACAMLAAGVAYLTLVVTSPVGSLYATFRAQHREARRLLRPPPAAPPPPPRAREMQQQAPQQAASL